MRESDPNYENTIGVFIKAFVIIVCLHTDKITLIWVIKDCDHIICKQDLSLVWKPLSFTPDSHHTLKHIASHVDWKCIY